jgi:hypothetical protein
MPSWDTYSRRSVDFAAAATTFGLSVAKAGTRLGVRPLLPQSPIPFRSPFPPFPAFSSINRVLILLPVFNYTRDCDGRGRNTKYRRRPCFVWGFYRCAPAGRGSNLNDALIR